MDNKELIKYAIGAQKKAYTPYSNFKVGAALLTKEGKVFTGCNIENAAYSPTICAERTAIAKAVSEGYLNFEKLAVVGGDDGAFPCGVCRQVIREFAKEIDIIIAKSLEDYRVYSLEDILPHSFGPDDLNRE